MFYIIPIVQVHIHQLQDADPISIQSPSSMSLNFNVLSQRQHIKVNTWVQWAAPKDSNYLSTRSAIKYSAIQLL